MNKKKLDEDNTVITSDKYLSESGVQGGTVLGDHISLASFIGGIPFLIIGLISLFGIFFDLGFPTNSAVIIASILVTVIGLLLIIGGYFNYRDKHIKK